MSGQRRQQILALALVALLVWLAATRLGDLFGGGGGNVGPGARLAAAEPIQGSFRLASDLADLKVEELDNKPGSYTPGRDPFRFGTVAPPPPRREPPPRVEPAERPVEEAPPPLPTGPQPPPLDVVYLGNFGPRDQPIAVLADDEAIYNVLVGDVIKENFRLVAIGYESVELEYVDFPELPAQRLAVGG